MSKVKNSCQFCKTCGKLSSRACKSKVPTTTPTPTPVNTGPGDGSDGKIPFAKLAGNLTLQQCETILSLVAIPENSTTNWSSAYDYCENIRDGRGITVSLVGFVSKYDLPDVIDMLYKINPNHVLVKKYRDVLHRVKGSDNTKGLENFEKDLKANNDNDWKKAVWQGINSFYWKPAMDFCASLGCKNAITKGFCYDFALNHGFQDLPSSAKKVVENTPKNGGNENQWLKEFIAQRVIIMKRDTTLGQTDRCDMWKSILDKNNITLSRPLTGLKCYGETFTIK